MAAPTSLILARRWALQPRQLCKSCLVSAPAARYNHALVRPGTGKPTRKYGVKMNKKLDDADAQWAVQAEKIKNGEEENLWDIFEERGYVKDIAGTQKHMRELMRVKRIGAYVGVDPTAHSLHVGHLLPFMPLFWMYMYGYRTITLLGGATAKIGDPSFRLTDREKVAHGDVSRNTVAIHYQLKKLWVNVEMQARKYGYEKEWAWSRGIHNNSAWWGKVTVPEFLRVLGSQVRVGPLLSRDTVKRKLTEGDGLSFAEMTYTLMQGWDWWKLYEQQGVQMQIGGSDQFGNIVTGIDAVKSAREAETHETQKFLTGFLHDPVGFTVPLLTNSAGEKIGKSTGAGNLWLDGVTTRPYDLYGYFVRQPDQDVERLLKLFTFIPSRDIKTLVEEHEKDKPKRTAQHRLAFEVLSLVHGPEVAEHTQQEHQLMHGGQMPIPVQFAHNPEVQIEPNNAPNLRVRLPKSLVYGKSIARILYAAGLVTSVSEGQRVATQKAAYVGNQAGTDPLRPGTVNWSPVATWFVEQTQQYIVNGDTLFLRKGKHNVRIVELVDDEEYLASGETYPGMHGTGRLRMAKKALQNQNQQNMDFLRDGLAEDPENEGGKDRAVEVDQLARWNRDEPKGSEAEQEENGSDEMQRQSRRQGGRQGRR